jgi:hypothetical protein
MRPLRSPSPCRRPTRQAPGSFSKLTPTGSFSTQPDRAHEHRPHPGRPLSRCTRSGHASSVWSHQAQDRRPAHSTNRQMLPGGPRSTTTSLARYPLRQTRTDRPAGRLPAPRRRRAPQPKHRERKTGGAAHASQGPSGRHWRRPPHTGCRNGRPEPMPAPRTSPLTEPALTCQRPAAQQRQSRKQFDVGSTAAAEPRGREGRGRGHGANERVGDL